MLASFVLRLVPEALAERRVVGRVEAVASGEAIAIRSEQELISFLYGGAGSGDWQAAIDGSNDEGAGHAASEQLRPDDGDRTRSGDLARGDDAGGVG